MRSAIRAIAILAVTTTTAGCMSIPSVWTKPGGDQSSFYQDKQQCIYQAQVATAGNPNEFAPMMEPGLVESCLRARGYVPESGS